MPTDKTRFFRRAEKSPPFGKSNVWKFFIGRSRYGLRQSEIPKSESPKAPMTPEKTISGPPGDARPLFFDFSEGADTPPPENGGGGASTSAPNGGAVDGETERGRVRLWIGGAVAYIRHSVEFGAETEAVVIHAPALDRTAAENDETARTMARIIGDRCPFITACAAVETPRGGTKRKAKTSGGAPEKTAARVRVQWAVGTVPPVPDVYPYRSIPQTKN